MASPFTLRLTSYAATLKVSLETLAADDGELRRDILLLPEFIAERCPNVDGNSPSR